MKLILNSSFKIHPFKSILYINNIEMSIQSEIENMYQKRYDRREIKKPPSDNTIYQHTNNITKLHTAITGNTPTLFGQMSWLDQKSAIDLLKVVKDLPGRKGNKLGIAAQRQYLTSILVAIRVMDFYKGQETPLFKEISDLLQKPLKDEIEAYRDQLKEETAESLPEHSEVMKLTENFIDGPSEDIDMKILLRIYTIYPIRLEAADLVFVKGKSNYDKLKKEGLSKNYLVKSKDWFFSFSDYKTSDKYGTQEISIKDTKLKKLLNQKTKEIGSDIELFPTISRNLLSKRITEFFLKNNIPNVSPTTLAKVIETHAYKSMPEEVRDKMKSLAEFRRHSLDTQAKFYVH
jgi:hypothetical protein